jgi:hypothetical protein
MKRPYLKFIPGGCIVGVPARDLSLEEAEQHGGVKVLVKTGLYELVEEKKAIVPDAESWAEGPISNKAHPGPKENKAKA